MELLNQMDGFDQTTNVKVCREWLAVKWYTSRPAPILGIAY
jgi:hypothetical protein